MGEETLEEAQRIPFRRNPRRNPARHILIKLTNIKYKEKNVKSSKGKATDNMQRNHQKDSSLFFSINSES